MSGRPQRWLCYALGGGCGHVVRSLALARVALRQGHDVEVVCNSAMAATLLEHAPTMRDVVHCLPASLDRDGVATSVRQRLARADFDALVVDTFPRGLAGELAEVLPQVGASRVLVHRDIDPAYLKASNAAASMADYDLLIRPGEEGALEHAQALFTAPWLSRDAVELPSREVLRQRWQIAAGIPLVLVSAVGELAERRQLVAVAERLEQDAAGRWQVRLCSLAPGVSGWHGYPLLERLPAADLVITAGGYNSVYEARALGIPLLAFARPRLYDRQHRRLRPEERLRAAAGPSLLKQVQAALQRGQPARVDYVNGAEKAAQAIARLVAAR